ncbi:MAG: hypothetical protein GJT30_14460 [Geobacter sp.]|nr:hypothetical protein [Geobacter sp.]
MNLQKIKEEKGIALVTALMLTLISLTMILALLYMITAGVSLSGAQKRYRTSLEASHGGAEIVLKDVIPTIMRNYSSSTLVTQVQNDFSGVGLQVTASQKCLQAKLTKPASQWPSGCSQASNPKQGPDLTFNLQASSGDSYRIYTKIIDTVKGNTDISGLQLEGAGVAESTPVLTPQHFPYIYRIEVQGERSTTSQEQANISALYAY